MIAESALTKQISITPQGKRNVELLGCAILLAWCVLPVVIACLAIIFGCTDGVTLVGDEPKAGQNFLRTQEAYRLLFHVLGCITLIYAIMQIAFNWRNLRSLDSFKKQPWLYLLAGLLVWAMISTLLADDPLTAILGYEYNSDGFIGYTFYASVFVCALSIRSERLRALVLRAFIVMVDVMSIVMLLESFDVYPFHWLFQSPRAAVFVQFNHLGYLLCMGGLAASAMSIRETPVALKVLHLASFTLIAVTLVINDTFGSYLAVWVGLLAMLVFFGKNAGRVNFWMLLPLVLYAVVSVVSFSDVLATVTGATVGSNFVRLSQDVSNISTGSDAALSAGTGRMKLWVEALKMIPERPLFGYGPEGLMGDYDAVAGAIRPHNEFIQCAVFLGVPALLLYLAALLSLFVAQVRRLKQLTPTTLVAATIAIGYAASSFFGCTMFGTAPYYWMALGLAACLPKEENHVFGLESFNISTTQTSPSNRVLKVASLLAVLAIMGVALYHGLERSVEASREACDLSTQDAAYYTAALALEMGKIEAPTDYLFDANTYSLSHIEGEKPTAYGQGTQVDGRATRSSMLRCENAYGYDVLSDYTDKVIEVSVDPTAGEDERIQLRWIDASL